MMEMVSQVCQERGGEPWEEFARHTNGLIRQDIERAREQAGEDVSGYNYYVYQYATSFTASTALAEKVLDKDKGAAEKVLTFLSSGGSKYPIDLLKQAGVDMTTSAPFDNTMDAMNRTMDEIEKILDKKGI
jgi:hypothetical protein